MPSPELFGQDLLHDLRSAWSQHHQDSRRAFSFLLAAHYYGVNSGQGLTLEGVGALDQVHLTRERVRQIIDGGVQCVRSHEPPLVKIREIKQRADSVPRPYARAAAWFHQITRERQSMFIALDDLLKVTYFAGFVNNHKGVIALLNDAGIRQVMYRNQHYLYPDGCQRKDAILAVQAANKQLRHQKTLSKMLDMSKTVTWVPVPIRGALKEVAHRNDLGLNRLYELVLQAFADAGPYRPKPVAKDGRARRTKVEDSIGAWKCFEKTTAWRSRNGKDNEAQVGIYIKKQIADVAKREAHTHRTSFMSYIRCAFVWFIQDLSEEERFRVLNDDRPAIENPTLVTVQTAA